MTSTSILPRFRIWTQRFVHKPRLSRDLHALSQHPDRLPRFVHDSTVAQRYLRLLGPINWAHFPERDLETDWGAPAIPFVTFAAACLVKLDQNQIYMSSLRNYLADHPALAWCLGFPLDVHPRRANGAHFKARLPTARHLTRMLRKAPNACFQYLLDETVRLLMSELRDVAPDFGRCISLDTKHIIAWVKENNPKAYVTGGRYHKDQQPSGDPDCRLGCKRKHNQRSKSDAPETPLKDAVPAKGLQVGEFYWGYASGVVATKVPGWGEFVLAELTQPFDQGDATYFHPLMAEVKRRLGFCPPFGAFDAAYDAFYVYEMFQKAGGFAAVPFVVKGKTKKRTFSAEGLPLCKAGLPMPLKFTYTSRTTSLVEHEKGHYVCPLVYPECSDLACPIDDPHWPKGCKTTLATSVGARIRHQLDRDSEAYKEVYKQRTATERVNALAKELGIERPKLRNGAAIANQNTLIYVLLNLRALQRVRQRKAAQP